MGSSCCKSEPDEIGEADRLLQNPISDEQYGFRTSRAGTWDPSAAGNGFGAFGSYGDRTDLDEEMSAAVAQILDSVAIQVIDVAAVSDTSNRSPDIADLAKRSRAMLSAVRERLASSSSTSDIRRTLPDGVGGGLQLLLPDDAEAAKSEENADIGPEQLRRPRAPRPEDLRLAAGVAVGVAKAVADFSVSTPDDLLAVMGSK